jgi:hypothetical protein
MQAPVMVVVQLVFIFKPSNHHLGPRFEGFVHVTADWRLVLRAVGA